MDEAPAYWYSDREIWVVCDTRTNTIVGSSSYFSREQVEFMLVEWKKRDARGKRPDLHESIPYWEPRLRTEVEEPTGY